MAPSPPGSTWLNKRSFLYYVDVFKGILKRAVSCSLCISTFVSVIKKIFCLAPCPWQLFCNLDLDVPVLQGPGYRYWSGISGRSLARLCHSPWPGVQRWVCSLPPPPGNSPFLMSKQCMHWKREKASHLGCTSNCFTLFTHQELILIELAGSSDNTRGHIEQLQQIIPGEVMMTSLCLVCRVQSSLKHRLQTVIVSTPWRDIQSHPGSRTSSLMTATQNSSPMRQSTPFPVCIACLMF